MNIIKKCTLVFGAMAFYILVRIPTVSAQTITTCEIDINADSFIDISDYSILAANYLQPNPSNPRADINKDGLVDISDYALIASNYLRAANCPSPTVTVTSAPTVGEWTQFGHDAQRTSYTAQTVATPWKYKWQWNGAGADGKKQAGHVSSPDLVQPVTGGGRVYTIAGNAVYALDQATGSVVWTKSGIGTLSSTPAYNQENLFVTSGNNTVYKLNAVNGSASGTFVAASPVNLAPLMSGNYIYVVSSAGVLYKIDSSNMTKVWEYAGGSPGVTVPSFSSSKGLIIYVTQDLYVHAINDSNGTRKWRVIPTTRTYTVASPRDNLTEALEGWPVIAEQHGIVFIRYRLEWQTLWNGPDARGTFPDTNAAARAFLVANPKEQALFALKMDDGSIAFIPNAGNGGAGDGGTLPMGPQPVIRVVNGQEVAYMLWRNKLVCASESWCDSREETTMGEMVLDSTTVPGYVAGDMRFVQWRDNNVTATYHDMQTDEMMYITGTGSTLFHNHWLTSEGYTITDRSNALGNTYLNPIKTSHAPNIIWRQVYCAPDNTNCNPQIFPGGTGFSWGPSNCPFNAATRYCANGLYGYGDQRGYSPGFYEYHSDNNSGSTPFVIVSNNLVLIKTNDGAIIALQNGNPLGDAGSANIAAGDPQGAPVLGVQDGVPPVISYKEAQAHLGEKVTVEGTIVSAVDNRPKALYLGFKTPHDGALLIRIFERDLSKFSYNPLTLNNKSVRITGTISLYWPEGKDPEIVVSDPSQIVVIE